MDISNKTKLIFLPLKRVKSTTWCKKSSYSKNQKILKWRDFTCCNELIKCHKKFLSVRELGSHIGSHVGLKICFHFLWYIFLNKVVCHWILIDLFTKLYLLVRVLCLWSINILLTACPIGDTDDFNIILLGFTSCPAMFFISKEKYLFMHGRPLPESSMDN